MASEVLQESHVHEEPYIKPELEEQVMASEDLDHEQSLLKTDFSEENRIKEENEPMNTNEDDSVADPPSANMLTEIIEPKNSYTTPVLKLNQNGLLQGFPEKRSHKRKRESDENEIFPCVQCEYVGGSMRSLKRHIEAKHIGLRKFAKFCYEWIIDNNFMWSYLSKTSF